MRGMGLSLEFYLGNADAISRAISDIELEQLDDPSIVADSADFSLHIEPADLELLSESMARFNGQKPQGFRQSLEILVDEEDRGALIVQSGWTNYVGTISDERVEEVVELWAASMRAKHNDVKIVVTEQMRTAVNDLVRLCRSASKGGGRVVHVWYL
jgi:hypothetical protein